MHLIRYGSSYLEPFIRTLSLVLKHKQQEKETEAVVKLSQGPSSLGL